MADRVVGNAIAGPSLILDHFDRAALDTYLAEFAAPLVAKLDGNARKGMLSAAITGAR